LIRSVTASEATEDSRIMFWPPHPPRASRLAPRAPAVKSQRDDRTRNRENGGWSRADGRNSARVPSVNGAVPYFQCAFKDHLLGFLRMNVGSKLHIAIEGCLGVGKTTLATKLAAFRKATLVLEEFEKNPFLGDFYRDPIGNVFETEMQFLLVHYHQLKALSSSAYATIADFTFTKDLIYGDLNFREESEKKMFVTVYEFLSKRLQVPDLVIYLKGSDELIIDRIKMRNRSIEQSVDLEYFRKLKRAYDDVFLQNKENVHIIDADHFDCLNDPTALERLCLVIDSFGTRASLQK
jgi:deoxyguanosine kinase